MDKGEKQQQKRDCMVKVDDTMKAGNGLWLKVKPTEVRHNIHDKHVCDLQRGRQACYMAAGI